MHIKTEPMAMPPTPAATMVKELPVENPVCLHAHTSAPPGGFDKLVIIGVGRATPRKEFHVHRGLLIHNSTYFQQHLPSKTSKPVSLVDEDPDVFETVSYWMYTSRFWALGTNKDGKIPFDLEKILEVYYFASHKGMEALQNATMTLLYQKMAQSQLYPDAISRIYTRTSQTDPLRKFLVDYMAETWGCETLERDQSSMSKVFLVDLLLKLKSLNKPPGMRGNRAMWLFRMNGSFCERYHVHSEENTAV